MNADNLCHRGFKPLLERAGLPGFTFHSLRHTSATLVLSKNVNSKIVSEMLGHATISQTMDTYSHVMPGMGDVAATTRSRKPHYLFREAASLFEGDGVRLFYVGFEALLSQVFRISLHVPMVSAAQSHRNPLYRSGMPEVLESSLCSKRHLCSSSSSWLWIGSKPARM